LGLRLGLTFRVRVPGTNRLPVRPEYFYNKEPTRAGHVQISTRDVPG